MSADRQRLARANRRELFQRCADMAEDEDLLLDLIADDDPAQSRVTDTGQVLLCVSKVAGVALRMPPIVAAELAVFLSWAAVEAPGRKVKESSGDRIETTEGSP